MRKKWPSESSRRWRTLDVLRYLILSDIHANVDALDTVLGAAPAATWDRLLVLGDLVGYGAEPNAVIQRVLALDPLATIRGNHDKAACWIEDAAEFNHIARAAALWTFEALTPEHRMYLQRLPAGPLTIDDQVEICHGTPFDEDHYIFGAPFQAPGEGPRHGALPGGHEPDEIDLVARHDATVSFCSVSKKPGYDTSTEDAPRIVTGPEARVAAIANAIARR